MRTIIILALAFLASSAAHAIELTPAQRMQAAAAIRMAGYPCVAIDRISKHGQSYRVDCGGAVYRATLTPLSLTPWVEGRALRNERTGRTLLGRPAQ